jgi:hypothetical protein
VYIQALDVLYMFISDFCIEFKLNLPVIGKFGPEPNQSFLNAFLRGSRKKRYRRQLRRSPPHRAVFFLFSGA